MKLEQISINLYTLREHLKTREAFTETIRRLAEIGYRSVQLSGVPVDLMPEAEAVAICAEHGIKITATHEPSDKVLNDPQWSIDRLKRLGVTQTAYPYPGGIDMADEETVKTWIGKLEKSRKLFADNGITLSYHNHHMEFSRLNGKLIMERILEETQMPAELDTYWVQMGGCDPVKWVSKMATEGRLPLVHLKDFRVTAKGEVQFAELGAGNLDFPAIIAAAEKGGCQSFIVEQDQTFGRDVFESVAESFNYLKSNFVR